MSIIRSAMRPLLLGALLAGTGLVAEAPWVTDWEAAKAQAAKESKTLLIDFSGSDWCGWCIRLEKEVFSQDVFIQGAKDKYVMVLLDFPRDKSKQSAELQAQNERLREEFPVEGYPSVFLATPEGVPFAKTGYQRGGPEAYLKHLDALVADHKEVAALKEKLPEATGVERAKILDGIYAKSSMRTPELEAYPDEIIKLDADGKAGLAPKYQAQKAAGDAMGLLRSGKQEEAKAALEKALAIEGAPAETRQELLLIQSQILFGAGDKKGAKGILMKAVELAPASDTAKQIEGILKGKWFEGVE